MPPTELQTATHGTLTAASLNDVTEMMRAISLQTDPHAIFREYASRVRNIFPVDRLLLLRGGSPDEQGVEVAELTDEEKLVHPWEESDRFSQISDSLLNKLFAEQSAQVIPQLDLDDEDPGLPYLAGMNSLRAIPLFDRGQVSHMLIGLKSQPQGFRPEDLPTLVWLSNLFGRSIQNLLLAQKVKTAYQSVDREMKVIGEIQQSLLPETTPDIPGMDISTYYRTCQRAGGDYYDFFELPDGKWGLMIADVSGHGTPAAVVMAILHSIAHTYTGAHEPPSLFLNYLNQQLSRRYTARTGTFVTAFFGVFNPATGNFQYASAGHNPPIRRRCGATSITMLDKAGRLPLGISEEITYDDAEELLYPGDRVVLYTDGIIEASSPTGELYGVHRLGEQVSQCDLKTHTVVDSVVDSLQDFTQTAQASDDRTLVVLKLK